MRSAKQSGQRSYFNTGHAVYSLHVHHHCLWAADLVRYFIPAHVTLPQIYFCRLRSVQVASNTEKESLRTIYVFLEYKKLQPCESSRGEHRGEYTTTTREASQCFHTEIAQETRFKRRRRRLCDHSGEKSCISEIKLLFLYVLVIVFISMNVLKG